MKIAIIEVSSSHEECIYTQVKFLTDSKNKVTLFLHLSLEAQIQEYKNLLTEVNYFDFDSFLGLKKIKLQWKLLQQLKGFDILIFNTASSSKIVRNLAFLLNFYSVQCIGILHNTKKLNSSFTQKIISTKIKKYYVLNDYLELKHKKLKICSFYPIFFPNYSFINKKKDNEIWISIPGRIDYNRRDYSFLINSLSKTKPLTKIKFIFLGKIDNNSAQGKQLIHELKQNNLLNQFIVFNNFIPNKKYHSILKSSDYILPLLQTENDYLNHKISGSFNLAFANKTPLICNSFFQEIPDLKENSLFYSSSTLINLLKEIDQGKEIGLNKYINSKWVYKFQKNKYLNFIKE
ncbi:hypothetical protein [uncultured Maribacter sp.]|uniref:hypothetical protein n=1 Tax=uncultured Maribacter sp. TaxID=431308 RepID=UPI00262537D1|nr:hypothetical protein [uncultured Maribacter sp.]